MICSSNYDTNLLSLYVFQIYMPDIYNYTHTHTPLGKTNNSRTLWLRGQIMQFGDVFTFSSGSRQTEIQVTTALCFPSSSLGKFIFVS